VLLQGYKGQDDHRHKDAVHLEHLPWGPQGLHHQRTYTQHCQTLKQPLSLGGRDLDRANQVGENVIQGTESWGLAEQACTSDSCSRI
jgi:hypothetical protein